MIKALDSNIEPEGDKEIQADFSCEITSDKSDKTKIHESFEIVGFNKTLLSPVLTDELINTGTMTNYTDTENQKAHLILKLNQLILLSRKKVNLKFLELNKILNLLLN